MKTIRLGLLALLCLLGGISMLSAQSKYRCLLQMKNYDGPKAYVVVSLIAPDGKLDKTLRILGPNKEWQDSLTEWYKAHKAKKENVDALTSASIGGGDRSAFILQLDERKLDKGYTIRFESCVEDQKYYAKDVVIPFTKEKLTERTLGTGYIKLVKLSPVK